MEGHGGKKARKGIIKRKNKRHKCTEAGYLRGDKLNSRDTAINDSVTPLSMHVKVPHYANITLLHFTCFLTIISVCSLWTPTVSHKSIQVRAKIHSSGDHCHTQIKYECDEWAEGRLTDWGDGPRKCWRKEKPGHDLPHDCVKGYYWR